MSPAWSLVRGTSTRQPNSGRLSHQDSLARLSTAEPTVTTTGPLTASSPAVFSATAASLATTLFCPVPEPPVVAATPGTTSKPTAVRPTASTSLTTQSEVNGSPATSRTTVPPDRAAATAALATSAGSPMAGVNSSSGRSARTASAIAGGTSGSTRTVSAEASAAVARAVSIPGSPGPAPTKTTLPAVAPFLRVMSCSWFWPRRARVRGYGGPGPAARPGRGWSPGGRHQLGGAAVEQFRGQPPAQPLGLGGRP